MEMCALTPFGKFTAELLRAGVVSNIEETLPMKDALEQAVVLGVEIFLNETACPECLNRLRQAGLIEGGRGPECVGG